MSYFLFLYQSPSLSLCTIFYSISSKIDEVLSINPCANEFVHHKDWLTYYDGTDIPGELYYNFSISNDLNQMVNFPNWILDCHPQSSALLDLLISSDPNFSSTMDFPSLGNSDHVVVSVPNDFSSNSKQDAPFHSIAYH